MGGAASFSVSLPPLFAGSQPYLKSVFCRVALVSPQILSWRGLAK